MRRLLAAALLLVAGAIQSGCATLDDAQAAKGSGTVKVYDKPYETVWNAVVQSVQSSGLDLVSHWILSLPH